MINPPWVEHPTRRRLYTGVVILEESTMLDRYHAMTLHAGPSGEWVEPYHWMRIGSPDPDLVSEIETALTTPLEAAIIHQWGVQAVLL